LLARLSRAPNFNAWMADTIRRHCGSRVLEIGCGSGNLTRELIPRNQYVASDINPAYLESLKTLSEDRPYLQTRYCDVTDGNSFPRLDEGFDTVVCLNVIEHIVGDRSALANIRSVLVNGGRAVILVPQGQWNFGTLDTVLGHCRRYSRKSLRQVAAAAGFSVSEMYDFNRIGTIAWFLNGKILRRPSFGLFQIWMLDRLTPFIRLIDSLLPLPGLSLVAVLERQDGLGQSASTSVGSDRGTLVGRSPVAASRH
jgi:SAM-dependent methyltransferase